MNLAGLGTVRRFHLGAGRDAVFSGITSNDLMRGWTLYQRRVTRAHRASDPLEADVFKSRPARRGHPQVDPRARPAT